MVNNTGSKVNLSFDVNIPIEKGVRYWISVETSTSYTPSFQHNNDGVTKSYYVAHTYADDWASSVSPSSETYGMFTAWAEYTPETFSITYDGNGNTSGSVPEDINNYDEDDNAVIKSNTGNLEKTGYSFAGWNTKADGTGDNYAVSSTLTMPAEDVTLYAKWQKISGAIKNKKLNINLGLGL
jgi:uncharacterized repeat protein (TIGR02543 family)